MPFRVSSSHQSTHEVTAKQLKRQRIRQLIVSMIGVAILVWGIVKIGCMFMDYKSNEKSDDAQVEQYISPVNMRASGYIKKIYFKEHQNVKKGDTLLVLDDREYRIRVMEAEAALALAKKYDTELPIIEEVNKVLFADKPAKEAVKDLMIREKRPEHTQLEWES